MIRRYPLPLLVNLLLGVPALVPLLCARWYLAHGHCGQDDLRRPDLDHCTYDQIESSGFVLFGLVGGGLFVLALVLLADVLGPLRRERPLTPWLVTLPALFGPYAALSAL
ncbi:hypothetical protein [Streptomyces sp. NPDC058739]|uniref:hypothetical protein n=1 Tax=Streptomyces sp. NPDC058739 TaxID=3346618 RepID=UPI003675E9C0